MINIRSFKRLQFYTDCYISPFNHCLRVFNPTDKRWLIHPFEVLLKIPGRTRFFCAFSKSDSCGGSWKWDNYISHTHFYFIPVALKQAAHTRRICTRRETLYLGHWATVSERGGQQEEKRQTLTSSYFCVHVCGWKNSSPEAPHHHKSLSLPPEYKPSHWHPDYRQLNEGHVFMIEHRDTEACHRYTLPSKSLSLFSLSTHNKDIILRNNMIITH